MGKLSKQYDYSYENKDGGGGNFAFNFPNAEYYKPKEGRNEINIIPFKIKTKKHPLVAKGVFEIGDYNYYLDVYVHFGVGENNSTVICSKKNYNKRCPICEQAEEYRNEGKDKEYKALKPKRRALYNVVDMKNPEKGVQIFEVSHFLFEKELIEEAKAEGSKSAPVPFADDEDGSVISFRASKTSLNRNEYLEFKSFKFIDRDEEIESEWLDDAVSFDEFIDLKTFDQIEALFNGMPEEDEPDSDESDSETDDEEPKKEKKKKSKSKSSCPAGYEFGTDNDEYEECDECSVWKECRKAAK